jgi:hypothetical protein
MRIVKGRTLTFELANRPGRPDRGDPPFAAWNATGLDRRFYEVTLGLFPYPRVAAELITDGGATRVPIVGLDPLSHPGLRRLVKGICRLPQRRQQLLVELGKLLETNLSLAFRAADEHASGASFLTRPEFDLKVTGLNLDLISVGSASYAETYDRHGYWIAEHQRGWIVLAEDLFFERLQRSVVLDRSGGLLKLDAAIDEIDLAAAKFRLLDEDEDSRAISRIQAAGLYVQTPCDPDGWVEHYHRTWSSLYPSKAG